MNVTLIAKTPCHICGHANKTIRFETVRVNKATLRTVGPSMIFAPRTCDECGAATPAAPCDQPTKYRLIPADQALVDEYRARKFKQATP